MSDPTGTAELIEEIYKLVQNVEKQLDIQKTEIKDIQDNMTDIRSNYHYKRWLLKELLKKRSAEDAETREKAKSLYVISQTITKKGFSYFIWIIKDIADMTESERSQIDFLANKPTTPTEAANPTNKPTSGRGKGKGKGQPKRVDTKAISKRGGRGKGNQRGRR